jgi:predicted ester cyclase
MASVQLRELPERFFKGQDRLKGPLPPELVAPGYRAEIVGFPSMDAAGHDAFGQAFYTGFPDIFHTIDDVRTTHDGVAVRFTLRGTNTGSFMGWPPTNRYITVSAIALLSVANGQVTQLHAIFDQLGLMQQLGGGAGAVNLASALLRGGTPLRESSGRARHHRAP